MRSKTFYRIKEIIKHIGASWDKMAPDKDNAIEFAYTHINQEPKRKIDAKHYTMEYTLAHSGAQINNRYRKSSIEDIDRQIAEMVSLHSTDIDLVLYRGVCDHVFNLMKENAEEIRDCDLYEKGFLATSLVKGQEINSKIKLRIKVPAGTKCVYMGNVNGEQEFYEVDVMHGSKLKIVSIDDEYINCELVATA